jgi:hypothetical protein
MSSISWLPIIYSYNILSAFEAAEVVFASRFGMAVGLLQASVSTFFIPKYIDLIKTKNWTSLSLLLRGNSVLGFLFGGVIFIAVLLSGALWRSYLPSDDTYSVLLIFILMQWVSLLFPSDGYLLISIGQEKNLVVLLFLSQLFFFVPAAFFHGSFGVAVAVLCSTVLQKMGAYLIFRNFITKRAF